MSISDTFNIKQSLQQVITYTVTLTGCGLGGDTLSVILIINYLRMATLSDGA